jgi:hypothetical protein
MQDVREGGISASLLMRPNTSIGDAVEVSLSAPFAPAGWCSPTTDMNEWFKI